MTLEEKVIAIIMDQLDLRRDEVNLDMTFDETGGDSLSGIELVLAFEEQFDVKIPDEDLDWRVPIRDMVSYIDERLPDVHRAKLDPLKSQIDAGVKRAAASEIERLQARINTLEARLATARGHVEWFVSAFIGDAIDSRLRAIRTWLKEDKNA